MDSMGGDGSFVDSDTATVCLLSRGLISHLHMFSRLDILRELCFTVVFQFQYQVI